MTKFYQEEGFIQEWQPLNQSNVNNHLSVEQLFAESATLEYCWVNMDVRGENVPIGGETHQGDKSRESRIGMNTFKFPI